MVTPASPATGTVAHRWIDRYLVDQLIHASDGTAIYVAIALAAWGVLVSALVALAAGALHPVAMYVIVAVAATVALAMTGVARHQLRSVRNIRRGLDSATFEFAIQVAIGVPTPVAVVEVTQAPTAGPAAGSGTTFTADDSETD